MAISKIMTTPTPLSVVEKVNEVIDGKLDTTATAASATTLSGLTATVAELNYVDGVTSNVQTQLDGKLGTTGTAAKATADASGNTITSTYETKANAITGLSVSGKTITYTKGNGATGTITTQDTVYSLPTASSSTLGGIKVGSGLSISSGVLSASGGSSAYIIPYATCSTATATAAKVATITNGVSFTLTAGALCYVDMSNSFYYPNSAVKVGAWTMNINSTGAKYSIFKYRTVTRDKYGTTITSNIYNTSYSSDATYGYIPSHYGQYLFMYNGTYYVIFDATYPATNYWVYNDYYDSGD